MGTEKLRERRRRRDEGLAGRIAVCLAAYREDDANVGEPPVQSPNQI